MSKKCKERISLGFLNAFFLALCFATLIPILYALSVSFSGQNSLLSSDFSFIPKDFTLENYKRVIFGEDILLWFKNTVLLAAVTVSLSWRWLCRRPTASPVAASVGARPFSAAWCC